MKKDILICGVGGQGILSIATIIGEDHSSLRHGRRIYGAFCRDHRDGSEGRLCHKPCEDRRGGFFAADPGRRGGSYDSLRALGGGKEYKKLKQGRSRDSQFRAGKALFRRGKRI